MIPIINYPEPMSKVRLASLKDDTAGTLRELQEAGMLQVEPAGELSSEEKQTIRSQSEQIAQVLSQVQDILSGLQGTREISIPEGAGQRSLEEMETRIKDIHERYSQLGRKYTAIQNRISNVQSLIQYLEPLRAEVDISLQDLHYKGSYLFSNVFVFSSDGHRHFIEKSGDGLLQHISADVTGEVVSLIIARTDSRKAIEKLAFDLGARELILPDEDMSLSRFFQEHQRVEDNLAQESEKIKEQIRQIIEDNLSDIVVYREILTEHNERLSVLEKLSHLHYATVIEGWAPSSRAGEISSALSQSRDYHFLEILEPKEKELPPSKLKNPSMIRPFQVIVNLFSIPRYGDWDPTPIVAYFFAFFFGLMLNDTIYALGLLVAARFFLDKLVDDPTSPGVSLFRNVLYISGTVALLFGVLSGVYLGDFLNKYFNLDLQTVALSSMIQEQLADPITFIILSLIIGMIHVNIAHILSLIKGIQQKKMGTVLNKIGLFIAEIFGIPYLLRALLNIELLPLDAHVYAMFAYPLLLGVVFIIIGSFMQMGFLGALFWIFDLTGFLGDIMSYSRLAGVGLATYYLASSFNLLADWFSSILAGIIPGIAGVIASFIVGTVLLIVLHTFNMLLSSLAAFIHSLRLCFVEFLMKFYEGGGREYAPFQVHRHKKVVVGTRS
jgi:V/A-type H+-transporting ATPase subunit I